MPRRSSQPSTSKDTKSKAKRVRQLRDSSSSSSSDSASGSDFAVPSNQASQTQRNSSAFLAAQNNTPNIETLTNNMVKYFLNFSANKYQIKRPEISKGINIHQKQFAEVLKKAKKNLKDVYGLEVSDVSEAQNSSAFIVHSAQNFGISSMQYTPESRNEITLLFIILSYIFMKGGEVHENHLNQFLDQLNIDIHQPHTVFGDIEKLLKEKFPRQMYLKRTKVTIEGVNEVQVHLAWGARAEKEFDKKEVLEAVAKITNRSPVTFINQFHAATGKEIHEETIVCD